MLDNSQKIIKDKNSNFRNTTAKNKQTTKPQY